MTDINILDIGRKTSRKSAVRTGIFTGRGLIVLFLWGVSVVSGQEPAASAPQQPAGFPQPLLVARTEAPRWVDGVWVALLRLYVRQRHLEATDEELGEVAAYDAVFSRTDRERRSKKLLEVERRLTDAGLPEADRQQLLRFRDVLARLAAHEVAVDRGEAEAPPQADRREIVEFWKANVDLHRRYGGIVTVMPFGHFAHGARLAWLADLEGAGAIVYGDDATRAAFLAAVSVPGPVVRAGEEDFTPYWRRPIPPSYFAE